MTISRYVSAPRLSLGTQLGTSNAVKIIRAAISDGRLAVVETTLKGSERLDTLAGAYYGDGRLWWLLAAASNIGWGMQVPAGTVIRVPDVGDALKLVAG